MDIPYTDTRLKTDDDDDDDDRCHVMFIIACANVVQCKQLSYMCKFTSRAVPVS